MRNQPAFRPFLFLLDSSSLFCFSETGSSWFFLPITKTPTKPANGVPAITEPAQGWSFTMQKVPQSNPMIAIINPAIIPSLSCHIPERKHWLSNAWRCRAWFSAMVIMRSAAPGIAFSYSNKISGEGRGPDECFMEYSSRHKTTFDFGVEGGGSTGSPEEGTRLPGGCVSIAIFPHRGGNIPANGTPIRSKCFRIMILIFLFRIRVFASANGDSHIQHSGHTLNKIENSF